MIYFPRSRIIQEIAIFDFEKGSPHRKARRRKEFALVRLIRVGDRRLKPTLRSRRDSSSNRVTQKDRKIGDHSDEIISTERAVVHSTYMNKRIWHKLDA